MARQGEHRMAELYENRSPITGLTENAKAIEQAMWDSVQEEWGGATIDAHTGVAVTGDVNSYAITARPKGTSTVAIPIGASRKEFKEAFAESMARFGEQMEIAQFHLGMFHNIDTGSIEIDPVLVVDTLDDAESIGAYTQAEGGAYNFADGLRYWPPYVAEGAPSGNEGQQGLSQGDQSVVRPGQADGPQ